MCVTGGKSIKFQRVCALQAITVATKRMHVDCKEKEVFRFILHEVLVVLSHKRNMLGVYLFFININFIYPLVFSRLWQYIVFNGNFQRRRI